MIGKLIGWLLNDVIVHHLANSKRFQGLALKIDSMISKNKKVITEDILKPGEKALKENLEKVKETKSGSIFSTFIAEFRQEISEAANKSKKGTDDH